VGEDTADAQTAGGSIGWGHTMSSVSERQPRREQYSCTLHSGWKMWLCLNGKPAEATLRYLKPKTEDKASHFK